MTAQQFIVNTFQTPVGWLEVVHDGTFLLHAFFTCKPTASQDLKSALSQAIFQELTAYLSNPQHQFSLPLNPSGTIYQQKVWKALAEIPAGQTLSYGQLALSLQSGPRAIGQACKKNPLVLFIPCHRIVGKDNLGGYMGSVAAINHKRWLLIHEGYEI